MRQGTTRALEATTAPSSSTTPGPTWACGPTRTSAPMMQLRSTAPAPTETRSQSTAPSMVAAVPTTHPGPRTAEGPTRQSSSSRQPAPITRGAVAETRAPRTASPQIELGLAVLFGTADVDPVAVADPTKEGQPVAKETGEELAFHGRDPTRRDARQQGAVEHVDAGVDGVGRALRRAGLLDEACHSPVTRQLDQAVGTGVAHARQENRRPRPALGVEAQHVGEVDVGQDVAVEHDDEAALEVAPGVTPAVTPGVTPGVTQEIGRVPDSSRRPQRLRLDGIVEPDAPGGAVAHDAPNLVHEIGARQHGALDSMPAQQRKLIGEERDVQERDDRLGVGVRQGTQPGALAPGQDDGGYVPGVQGCASLMSITGMPSRIG